MTPRLAVLALGMTLGGSTIASGQVTLSRAVNATTTFQERAVTDSPVASCVAIHRAPMINSCMERIVFDWDRRGTLWSSRSSGTGRDSNRNGTLIGAGVGAAYGMTVAAVISRGRETGEPVGGTAAVPLMTTGIGAAVGYLIDRWR